MNEVRLIGDINNDGIVDNQDIVLMQKYLSGQIQLTGIGLLNADLDGNGIVDNNDLRLLSNYLVGGDNYAIREVPIGSSNPIINNTSEPISFHDYRSNLAPIIDINGNPYNPTGEQNIIVNDTIKEVEAEKYDTFIDPAPVDLPDVMISPATPFEDVPNAPYEIVEEIPIKLLPVKPIEKEPMEPINLPINDDPITTAPPIIGTTPYTPVDDYPEPITEPEPIKYTQPTTPEPNNNTLIYGIGTAALLLFLMMD